MTQEIGNKESLIQSKLNSFELELEEILVNLGSPNIDIDPDIEKILKFSYEELCKIHPEDCLLGAYKLKQYAIFIQQKENRFKNIKFWAKSRLDYIIGKHAQNYGTNYTKWEEKTACIIEDNSYAKELNELYIKYQAFETEVALLCNRITDLARTLTDISIIKREK